MDDGTLIMATITLCSVIVAIYTVYDSKNQYIDSIQPTISLKLTPTSKWLNLEILNAGKSAAYKVSIKIKDIQNLENGYIQEDDNISNIVF
ncbi:MAG: hypothetical protein MJZ68_09775, partial [archaeon]|nr:hypothetical protein [archaeon]